ncbi:GTPase HflX [Lachnoclostridium phytofermentans]|uniref:GTPase HflX n=1 Tax=Lachnoclostridium phytofermentans (strain ATCC 700394 / DSM 18823 / ISDg) TaxID=357809 RepID=A9KMM6_LACP7|nr:GTPase HflX [Lachnoclostridium phytofermentans]ABX41471.1 GTP-binding proten HflX [Lachnoclostridium phytofermentans ISDg]
MKQIGIIVGVNVKNEEHFHEGMQELIALSDACDIEIVDSIVQNADSINRATYLGKGKLAELGELARVRGAEVVIFNGELTASQIRNIQTVVDTVVLDRTNLILTIFASRAKTREAKLQVEVVRLQYELPRLIGANENLSRQAGGIGGGTGAGGRNKGAGETKLELDKRRVEEKINVMQRELEELITQRLTQRNQRKKNEINTVALVGYTNAGKSTVMNYMVQQFIGKEEKEVLAKDMLFATLETSVRKINLKNRKEFLLSDTVGFVSNLPHKLVKAFRSTLEEVCEADLLVHVVDRSNEDYQSQIEVTNATLSQIGAGHIPVIYAYNKADLIKTDLIKEEALQGDMEEKQMLETKEDTVLISAKKGDGMNELIELICKRLYPNEVRTKVLIPYHLGALIAKINASTNILSSNSEEAGMVYEIECNEQIYQQVEAFVLK